MLLPTKARHGSTAVCVLAHFLVPTGTTRGQLLHRQRKGKSKFPYGTGNPSGKGHSLPWKVRETVVGKHRVGSASNKGGSRDGDKIQKASVSHAWGLFSCLNNNCLVSLMMSETIKMKTRNNHKWAELSKAKYKKLSRGEHCLFTKSSCWESHLSSCLWCREAPL